MPNNYTGVKKNTKKILRLIIREFLKMNWPKGSRKSRYTGCESSEIVDIESLRTRKTTSMENIRLELFKDERETTNFKNQFYSQLKSLNGKR